MSKLVGTVYLVHFLTPLHHARHYLGFSADPAGRFERHAAGAGARLMAVVEELGIEWVVARTWVGDRHFERRLKRCKNSPRLCPLCRRNNP